MDTDLLLDTLKQHYPEYRRQKQQVFRREVLSALERVLTTTAPTGLDVDHMSDDSAEAAAREDFDAAEADPDTDTAFEARVASLPLPAANMLNMQLQAKYKAQNSSRVVGGEAGLFIATDVAVLAPAASVAVGPVDAFAATSVGKVSSQSRPGTPGISESKKRTAPDAATSVTSSRQKRRRLSDSTEGRQAVVSEVSAITADPAKHTAYETIFPVECFKDLGGMDACIQDVKELVGVMFTHLEIILHLSQRAQPKGLLLHGPPGCGKTLLAHAIAGEFRVPLIKVAATALVGGTSGDSEKCIRDLFDFAIAEARASPHGCLLFIDEIDVITPKRETAQREMERRMVAQLLSSLDDLTLAVTHNKPLLVVGATNRPESIDPALRRSGRFDRELCLSVPDLKARQQILELVCRDMRLEGDFDFGQLANMTPGYVGADISALANEAALMAVMRVAHELQVVDAVGAPGSTVAAGDIPATDDDAGAPALAVPPVQSLSTLLVGRQAAANFILQHATPFSSHQLAPYAVSFPDFIQALKRVQPSAQREGFAVIPNVTWDDVGALSDPRRELEEAIVLPLQFPELCARVGIETPPGVLLYGPPGCGKTLLAKAVANTTHANFISVKGPELLNKFVGESERAIRQLFIRARTSAPCVIFFDELDALCPRRDQDSGNAVTKRLVNQLLTELDGFDVAKDKMVFVIAATNRPDMIDSAMLRPGRLDKLVYVDIPDEPARLEILRTHARKVSLARDVDLAALARDVRCERFSGADLAALVREAATATLRRALQARRTTVGDSSDLQAVAAATGDSDYRHAQMSLSKADFEISFGKVFASVSEKDLKRYRTMQRKLRGVRSHFDGGAAGDEKPDEIAPADHASNS